MKTTFEILDSIDEQTIQRMKGCDLEQIERTKSYLAQQKEEILQKLNEQEYEILNMKKNRHAYCFAQLQDGLQMFGQGIRQILTVFFALLSSENYLKMNCQDEISAKVMHLRSTIEKNWAQVYKQITRGKEPDNDARLRKIKREGGTSRKKGLNCKIPKECTYILEIWLLKNFNDPYPNQQNKVQMAKLSGLSVYQVNNWFINARERIVKKFHKKESHKSGREYTQI